MREVPGSSSLATFEPDRLDRVDKFGAKDAEQEVMEAETQLAEERREAKILAERRAGQEVNMELGEDDNDRFKAASTGSGTTSMTVTPPTPFQFAFPPPSKIALPVRTPPVSRRRSGAPTSIPNFPSATAPRGSSASSPSSNSPVRSPFRAPLSPNTPPTVTRGGSLSLPAPALSTPSGQSPWQMLAETSGAPTPSLHGPGRSSPHLGGPFEKLNLGSSWSGSNLWADGAASGVTNGAAGRRASADHSAGLGGGTSTRSAAGSPSMSAETLARYRAMAGKASASGARVTQRSDDTNGSSTSTPSVSTHPSPSKAPLPPALASRRASVPKNILDSLSPPVSHTTKSPSPLASEASSESSPAPPKLQPIAPRDVSSMIAKISTLVLDVRPPSLFQSSHISSAHSLPIPSTLLRRPAFNLNRLVNMLAPPSMEAVAKWKTMDDIVLLDLDSTSAPEGSILEGLAGKFEREGFNGHLWFIKGGQAAAQGAGVRMETEVLEDEATADDPGPGPSAPTLSISAPAGKLMGTRLGKLAFQSGSTGSQGQSRQPSVEFVDSATPGVGLRLDPFNGAMTGLSTRSSVDAISFRGLKSGSELSLASNISNTSSKKSSYQAANPFFDNIRQNLELAHGGITERIPLNLPQEIKRRAHELPGWLADLVEMGEEEGAERLAEQFYQVELCEQKRLQAVMDWHSRDSGMVVRQEGEPTEWAEQMRRDNREIDRLGAVDGDNSNYFPFSITAGVERGTKNRYKNIWPYDFSRVKLDAPSSGDTDYINASFVQPRGTSRRYIATQGPLDATYCDFWTLVWEQDVRVIVMLTKQYEGGHLKCGNYWEDLKYGPFSLRLTEQTGGDDKVHAPTTGFDFGATASAPAVEAGPEVPENIKRVFVLSNHKSDAPPRKIIQLQCTAWPDFDVPDTPDILLALIRDMDAALLETRPDDADRAHSPPILVHCSAGVGRTGSFIIVDAMLDGLRREHKNAKHLAIEDGEKLPRLPTILGVEHPNKRNERKSGSPTSGGDSRKSGSPDNVNGSEGDLVSAASRQSATSSGLASDTRYDRSGSISGTASRGTTKSVSFVDVNPDARLSAPQAPATIPPPSAGSRKSSQSPGLSSHAIFSTSPASMMSPSPGQATRDVPSFFETQGKAASTTSSGQASKGGSSGGTATERGDRMDVDFPSEAIPIPAPAHHLGFSSVKSPVFDNSSFTAYRTNRAGSTVSSEGGFGGMSDNGRRPSLGSVFASSDRMSTDGMHKGLPKPVPITRSADRHRTPSPVSHLENPIAAVLEGMRVQRMSLVQSLRQYVFVHRAIIHNYLAMIDEESDRESKESTAESDAASFSRSSTGPARSTSGEGDEPHKRRASPTELSQDRTPPKSPAPSDPVALARRGSVKRMRGAEYFENPTGEGSDAGSTGSANIIGMKRRGSKQ